MQLVSKVYQVIFFISILNAFSTFHTRASETSDEFSLLYQDSQQLIVVLVENDSSIIGQLSTFELKNTEGEQQWQPSAIKSEVVVGKKGIAWGKGLHPFQHGQQKREGDGKAPSGVFRLLEAYGYLNSLETKMPYQSMTVDDYCIDVNGSPFYNQIISKKTHGEKAVAGSSEPMRRDLHLADDLYKKGVIIGHNPNNISAAGSCIFMHIWRGEGQGTAGCTAMPEQIIDQVLAWLDVEKNPLFILMSERDYLKRQQAWHLPKLSQLSR